MLQARLTTKVRALTGSSQNESALPVQPKRLVCFPEIPARLEKKLKAPKPVWTDEDLRRAEEIVKEAHRRGDDWRIEPPELLEMYDEREDDLKRYEDEILKQVYEAMELDADYRRACEEAIARASICQDDD